MPLIKFVIADENGNYYLDWNTLEKAARMIVRIGLRQTFVDIPMKGWDETQKKERLLGVSATGWRDAFDMLGWSTHSKEASKLRTSLRQWENEEATDYANKLGVERPLMVTTVKPEGTASQVFGCSAGLHWNWAPYYIRRVRMGMANALTQALLDQGFNAFPETYDLDKLFAQTTSNTKNFTKVLGNGFTNAIRKLLNIPQLNFTYQVTEVNPVHPDLYAYKNEDAWTKLKVFANLSLARKKELLQLCNTVVFEFPVKSPAKTNQGEVSALEQLENMKLFSQEYTDHMPSSTITVKEHEWDLIPVWLHENWNKGFITVSFLAYFGSSYPLLPNEDITEEVYNQMVNALPESCKEYTSQGIYFKVNQQLLNKYEAAFGEVEEDLDYSSECSSSGCPIR